MTYVRDLAFAAVWTEARKKGLEAGHAIAPRPMVICEADNLTGQPKPDGRSWSVDEGACGFAWVNIRPGNCGFAKWLKGRKFARKAYRGGVDIWISDFSQSIERKEACARVMAEIIRNRLGIEAYADSRLD